VYEVVGMLAGEDWDDNEVERRAQGEEGGDGGESRLLRALLPHIDTVFFPI